MNQSEIAKLKIKNLLGDSFFETLKSHNAIIAGGCLTSIYSNKDVNDVDVYFRTETDLKDAIQTIYEESEAWFTFITPKSLSMTVKQTGIKVQFIKYNFFGNTSEIFREFDFTCCMAAYDLSIDEIIMDNRFIWDLAKKTLVFSGETRFPINTLGRVSKYQQRGYTISNHQLMMIGLACSKLKIENWEDVREHFGGMYGMKLKDDLPEFGFEFLMNNIDTLMEPALDVGFDSEMLKKEFGIDVNDFDLPF